MLENTIDVTHKYTSLQASVCSGFNHLENGVKEEKLTEVDR